MGSGVKPWWRRRQSRCVVPCVTCRRGRLRKHYDLVVLARRTAPNGLPPDLIEKILLGCGRPLLIAPPQTTAPASRHGHGLLEGNGRGGARGRRSDTAPRQCRACRSPDPRARKVAEADRDLDAGFCPCERRARHAEIARRACRRERSGVPGFTMAAWVASRAASCTELHRSRGTEGSNPAPLPPAASLLRT
jgi:hypothetical protein